MVEEAGPGKLRLGALADVFDGSLVDRIRQRWHTDHEDVVLELGGGIRINVDRSEPTRRADDRSAVERQIVLLHEDVLRRKPELLAGLPALELIRPLYDELYTVTRTIDHEKREQARTEGRLPKRVNGEPSGNDHSLHDDDRAAAEQRVDLVRAVINAELARTTGEMKYRQQHLRHKHEVTLPQLVGRVRNLVHARRTLTKAVEYIDFTPEPVSNPVTLDRHVRELRRAIDGQHHLRGLLHSTQSMDELAAIMDQPRADFDNDHRTPAQADLAITAIQFEDHTVYDTPFSTFVRTDDGIEFTGAMGRLLHGRPADERVKQTRFLMVDGMEVAKHEAGGVALQRSYTETVVDMVLVEPRIASERRLSAMLDADDQLDIDRSQLS